MTTQSLSTETPKNRYYDFNSYSTEWQNWSLEQISCSTPYMAPVGAVGLLASLVLRVVEGTFKLIANVFLAVKYCCSCESAEQVPPQVVEQAPPLPPPQPRRHELPVVPRQPVTIAQNSEGTPLVPPVIRQPSFGNLPPQPIIQIYAQPEAPQEGAPQEPDLEEIEDPIRRCGANLQKKDIPGYLRTHQKTSIAVVGLAGAATAGAVALTGALFLPAAVGATVSALAWKALNRPTPEREEQPVVL